jgi:hypothetical protein
MTVSHAEKLTKIFEAHKDFPALTRTALQGKLSRRGDIPTEKSPELVENYDNPLDFEIAFLEGVLDVWPENIEALKAIAEDYTSRGLYSKGLLTDLKLAKLLPHDPTVHYNLACSHALVGNRQAAFDALETAISLGYSDLNHMCADPDIQSIRSDPRFQELVGRIKQSRKDSGDSQSP